MKIKILKNFNGNVDGQSVRFTAGEVRDVPDHAASHFIAGAYAEPVTPAVKVVHKGPGGKMKVEVKNADQ